MSSEVKFLSMFKNLKNTVAKKIQRNFKSPILLAAVPIENFYLIIISVFGVKVMEMLIVNLGILPITNKVDVSKSFS